jgi:regulator of RNase E activity RraA
MVAHLLASTAASEIVAVDNHGDVTNKCRGEVLACAAQMKCVSAVVLDGATRDRDASSEMQSLIYARAAVPIPARGGITQKSFNRMIRLGGLQVRPGDVIVGDLNGVVVLSPETLGEIVAPAEALMDKEERMKADLRAGMAVLEVDRKHEYEQVLSKNS